MSHVAAVSLVLLLSFVVADHISKKKRHLPPGPPSYPFIGQLLSAPVSLEYVEYRRISRELKSDIISFEFLGNTIVVLHSAQSASDLFDKRSGIYSDRTTTPMVEHEQLLNWGNTASLVRYGDKFRAYRRVYNQWLNKNASRAFQPRHLLSARKMLNRLLQYDGKAVSSKTLEDEFFFLSASSIMKAAYGYEVTSPDNPYVAKIKQVDENLISSFLPTRNWIPGTGWKKTAKEWRELKDGVIDDTFNWTQAQMASAYDNGTAGPSIIRSYLEGFSSRGENISKDQIDTIKQVGIALFGAGTDSSAASLVTFVLAMLLFPAVQRKAQDEIDRVVGPDRLPEMEDLQSLPYLNNLVQEVLRWRNVFPLGVPHTCTEDNFYRGYLIPKGAVVIGNVWAMSHDENVYERPEEFDPDRFDDPSVPPAPAFGWGRRKRPGSYYAESLLSISIASILATFNFTMAKDEQGHDIVPSAEYTTGMGHPLPFTCVMSCRSDHRRRVVVDHA